MKRLVMSLVVLAVVVAFGANGQAAVPMAREFNSRISGTVTKLDAGMIGQAAMQLGAGRAKASDGVDAAVGFDRLVKVGETVHAGHPLCRIHARGAVDFEMAEAMLGMAVKISAH